MVRVIVQHQTKSKKDSDKLIDAIHELRMEAMKQPGYVTGETLINSEDSRNVLVISTWNKEEQWNAWDTSENRINLTKPINSLLKEPYAVTIYNFAAVKAGRVMSIF